MRKILFAFLLLSSIGGHSSAGIQVNVGNDGYDDDDVYYENVWIGPGWYYGIWFGSEAEYWGWRGNHPYWANYYNRRGYHNGHWHNGHYHHDGHGGHGGHGGGGHHH